MNKIKIGDSLKVSVLGLGAINFGTKTSQAEAFELLDKYLELGGNFIDTSNNYAVWNGGDGGDSERVIGEWINQRAVREKVVIATKVGARPKHPSQKDFSDMEGLGKETILKSVRQSLQNLQTDYIDLLYLHVDDFSIPQEEVMETLNGLVEEGKVRELGCSNFYAWRIECARKICEKRHYHFFCAVQQRYSYLTPAIDADFYPQVAVNQDLTEYLRYYKDLTLVAYSPLLQGQYNRDTIAEEEYQTSANEERLASLRQEEINPNVWVIRYIINSFQGSVALLTTSDVYHLDTMMRSIKSWAGGKPLP